VRKCRKIEETAEKVFGSAWSLIGEKLAAAQRRDPVERVGKKATELPVPGVEVAFYVDDDILQREPAGKLLLLS
jgi:hypothetical protein